MKEESQLSAEQSLHIINEMVQRARFNLAQGAMYFIIWGILLSASALYEFIAGAILHQTTPWIGWPIAGVVGGLLSYWYGARKDAEQRTNHLDRIYSMIWVIFFITLIILIVALVRTRVEPGSYILIITGLPTYFTGRLLRFKPLQFGGVGFWVIGLFSLYFFEEYQSVFFALAMVQGYIIPGLWMMNKQG